jgi:hypothetical protein
MKAISLRAIAEPRRRDILRLIEKLFKMAAKHAFSAHRMKEVPIDRHLRRRIK